MCLELLLAAGWKAAGSRAPVATGIQARKDGTSRRARGALTTDRVCDGRPRLISVCRIPPAQGPTHPRCPVQAVAWTQVSVALASSAGRRPACLLSAWLLMTGR